MKIQYPLFLVATLFACTSIRASDMSCTEVGNEEEQKSIRTQRQAFNEAIANKDDQVIEAILLEDVILITGTDSDLYEDRDAQVTSWQGDFVQEDRAVYVRTPACIRVSGVAPVALEFGYWRGERINNSSNFATGSYSAKWRKTAGQWLLEVETFSTEACGGTFCPTKAP